MFASGYVYGPVIMKLARDWQTNPTYSHGFVVPLLSIFLLWQQRHKLRAAQVRPSAAGLLLLLASLGLLVAGTAGAELFITRISMLGVIAGTVLYAFGWQHLRIAAVPLAFLLFMIPLPSIVFDRAALALQLAASRLGEELLRGAGVAVLRDGNLLTLATVQLEVNEACSGIRSMVALLMMTTLVGYLFESRPWRAAVLVLIALPLAIGLNGVRIAVTGLATTVWGPAAADGMIHAAAGWVVFVAALVCVWGMHLAMQALDRAPMKARLGVA